MKFFIPNCKTEDESIKLLGSIKNGLIAYGNISDKLIFSLEFKDPEQSYSVKAEVGKDLLMRNGNLGMVLTILESSAHCYLCTTTRGVFYNNMPIPININEVINKVYFD